MRFLMLICEDAETMDDPTEHDPTDPDDNELFAWLDDVQARGIRVGGSQLAPSRQARSVRVRDGKTMVTDGPFAETKEVVGGFDILSAAASRRLSRLRPDTLALRRARSRFGRSGGTDCEGA
jgi:hypothetical protein